MSTATTTPVEARQRPWPAINEDTAFFWEGVDQGELRIQSCADCTALVHPPRPHCAACGSLDRTYVVASGRGRVYSHVTFHKPLAPPFTEPYSVAVVELEEGTRIVSQVIGITPDDVRIDLPVRLVCSEVEPGLVLPLFEPADTEEQ